VTKKKTGQRPGTMHIDKRAARLLADHVSEGADDELLSTRQVADWLQVSEAWLEIARHRCTGPRYERIAPRIVKYRRGAIREFLRLREHSGTAEYRKRPR
jgi:predicted DNA-binding transcriptional regulator AlpA